MQDGAVALAQERRTSGSNADRDEDIDYVPAL
jgi:hypothetical protein